MNEEKVNPLDELKKLGAARLNELKELGDQLFKYMSPKDLITMLFPPALGLNILRGTLTGRTFEGEDFNNDKIDAGEVGSGHSVTAIYEITPVGTPKKMVDDLRYAKQAAAKPDAEAAQGAKFDELGFLKLRYKLPNETASRLQSVAIKSADALKILDQAKDDVRFAVAVAAFGQLLKSDPWIGKFTKEDVIKLALQTKGQDPYGLRAEFINLVRLANTARP